MTVTSMSHDREAGLARLMVEMIAEMRPGESLLALAVGLARAEQEFGGKVGAGGRIRFDLAVRDRFNESMLQVAEASGPTAEAAEAALKQKVNLWEKTIVEQRVEPAGRHEQEVHAHSEEDARQYLLYFGPLGGTLVTLSCVVAPKRGFLGIGKRRGTWKAIHDVPFRATAIYR